MPIVGNLNEFPLPEILILIGNRTGKMRLFDVPNNGLIEIDFYEGHLVGMRIGQDNMDDSESILNRLARIVKSGIGMFEFELRPLSACRQAVTLSIQKLVIELCVRADESNSSKLQAAA